MVEGYSSFTNPGNRKTWTRGTKEEVEALVIVRDDNAYFVPPIDVPVDFLYRSESNPLWGVYFIRSLWGFVLKCLASDVDAIVAVQPKGMTWDDTELDEARALAYNLIPGPEDHFYEYAGCVGTERKDRSDRRSKRIVDLSGHATLTAAGFASAIRETKKDTNPKDAVGVRKWRQLSTVPALVVAELGVAMLEGARKYGRHNYRVSGVRASVYYDAAMGHLMQWWEGEDIDPDSGLSHVTKAIASLAVLRDAMQNEMIEDDRPPCANLHGVREELQRKVEEIIDRYPEPLAAHTEKEG